MPAIEKTDADVCQYSVDSGEGFASDSADAYVTNADVICCTEAAKLYIADARGMCGGADTEQGDTDAWIDDSPHDNDEEEDSEADLYGWGRFCPACLQWLRNPKWFLFFICWIGAVQGMIVNGFVNVVITTVEKRFSLSSAEAGLIASSYDIAAVLLALPVSYLGAHAHKPRWLGIGSLIMGLGSFVFCLPHLAAGALTTVTVRNDTVVLCGAAAAAALSNDTTSLSACGDGGADRSLNHYKYVFYLGQLLHGIGAAPLYTIGVAFIDDNVRPKLVSVYVAIYYTMALVGPAIGYMAGGYLLQIYVDAPMVDPTDIRPDQFPRDFVCSAASAVEFKVGRSLVDRLFGAAFICLLISIPMLEFPERLPVRYGKGVDGNARYGVWGSGNCMAIPIPHHDNGMSALRDTKYNKVAGGRASRAQAERVKEHHGSEDEEVARSGFGKSLRDLPLAFKNLLFNPTYMCLNMAGATEAIYYTMALVGPAIGYMAGGYLLQIYVDAPMVDPTELGLQPSSSNWVGAWWIGFFGAAFICLLISIPMLGFPRALPGASRAQAERVKEHHGSADEEVARSGFGKSLRTFLWPSRICSSTLPTCALTWPRATEGLLLAGFATFMPKYIEFQYMKAAGVAAIVIGIVVITAGGTGNFLGGYFVKRFRMSFMTTVRYCTLAGSTAIIASFIFLVQCPQMPLVGLAQPHDTSALLATEMRSNLSSACSQGCRCERETYAPICGVDGVTYYSPCHAGCKTVYPGSVEAYGDCSCIQGDYPDAVVMATSEPCRPDCSLQLGVFLATFFIIMFQTFIVSIPALSATIRSVVPNLRSFAIGKQWLYVRLLGTIPAPLLFGTLIDSTCQVWSDTCAGGGGSCRVYDNHSMGRRLLLVGVCGKTVSSLFFLCSWLLYRPPEKSPTTAAVAAAEVAPHAAEFLPTKSDPNDVSVDMSVASKASSGYDTCTQATSGTLESRASSGYGDPGCHGNRPRSGDARRIVPDPRPEPDGSPRYQFSF
ncbi:PREDICTED: solute carrier organic anion transporter family member 4A1-like [Priapulus caudatus]|uniref:Solute carrier organic anion transporter family member n=1 Tax=Priapulus caudatus TaxID=37621 RepID=A0ABM1DX26_PRICU|nr:PREDICTED: solute carrier organic anion transporter family member 4A1-like [Priapulus caudatus]